MTRVTERLMRCFCPECGVALQVLVRDVPLTMTNDQWCATLDDEDAKHLHRRHDETPVVEQRSRTRRITR